VFFVFVFRISFHLYFSSIIRWKRSVPKNIIKTETISNTLLSDVAQDSYYIIPIETLEVDREVDRKGLDSILNFIVGAHLRAEENKSAYATIILDYSSVIPHFFHYIKDKCRPWDMKIFPTMTMPYRYNNGYIQIN
jgi:hypothetical protein